MPARIIGMIGTQQEGVAVHLIKGQISRQWVIDFTRLHEQWNYDSVLLDIMPPPLKVSRLRFTPPTTPSGSSS